MEEKGTAIQRRLAELIERDGRSQSAIAAAAGVSQQVVSGLVTGSKSDPRAEVVALLGRALGLTPAAAGRLLYECFPGPPAPAKKIPDRG